MTQDKFDKKVVLEELNSSITQDISKLSGLKLKIHDLKSQINQLEIDNTKSDNKKDNQPQDVNVKTEQDHKSETEKIELIELTKSNLVKNSENVDTNDHDHDHDHGACGCCTQFGDDYDCDSDIED